MRDPYDLLAAATGFQWDDGNDTKSREKHSVTNAECEECFFSAPLVARVDDAHSLAELRFAVLGESVAGRRLFVVFTMRGSLIRVISARPMSRREREVYRRAQLTKDAEAPAVEAEKDREGEADVDS